MKININQVDLKLAIEKAEKLFHKTYKDKNLNILNSVLLKAENNKITITANNLESAIEINIWGNIIEPGSITIDKDNFKLIKKLSGELTITKEDNNIVVIKANRNLKFTSVPTKNFPAFPENIEQEAFVIPEDIFKSKLKIKSFASSDEFKKVFNSIVISENNMISSNTCFISKIKLNIENKCKENIIIPLQSINELDKILDKKSKNNLKFYCDNNLKYLKIIGNDFTYITKLIGMEYPDFSNIFPDSFNTFINIKKEDLQDSVNFIKEMNKKNKDETDIIIFKIDNEQFKIYTPFTNNKSMSETISADIQGDNLEIGFDNNYIDIILKSIKDEEVNISLTKVTSPAVFKSKNEDELYLLLPVRLSK